MKEKYSCLVSNEFVCINISWFVDWRTLEKHQPMKFQTTIISHQSNENRKMKKKKKYSEIENLLFFYNLYLQHRNYSN